MNIREQILEMETLVNSNIIGQSHVIRRLIIALLADGNVLLEGLPGLAKTRSINSLSKYLHSELSRIQFVPDLLPSDVTGTEILNATTGKFEFQQGPIFANLILADEINRAPAKVQSALLEAMQEGQVTVNGTTHKLPDLFLVMATQNPVEQEGTYPLPEAQMDRFLLHVSVEYPDVDAEIEVLRLVRSEEKKGEKKEVKKLSQEAIFAAREEIHNIHVSEAIEKYIVHIIDATRFPEKYDQELASWLDLGSSPRGTIALEKCARVVAWLDGRDHVVPDDVQSIAHAVLRHRIALSYEANAQGVKSDKVIDKLLEMVAVV